MVYAYCRVSTPSQNIERQVRNILRAYPEIEERNIYQEKYTGRVMDERKEFSKLCKVAKTGDTIVFDSVSRMSRNAEEGVRQYFDWYRQGVDLVFLNEPMIDTKVYRDAEKNRITLTDTDIDCILQGINQFLGLLAKHQIEIAFAEAQKEVDDLSSRTKGGIETARRNGKKIGRAEGDKLTIKKKAPAQEIMLKHCKEFGGTLSDAEVMKLVNLSRNTYYKYKGELKQGKA